MLKYEESANMLAELHSKPKESLDHFTKKFMDLLNILKRSGAPMDESNKTILFFNFQSRALSTAKLKSY